MGSINISGVILTLSGLYKLLSARSTLVRTKIVRCPDGSISVTRFVTLLLSASKEPSKDEFNYKHSVQIKTLFVKNIPFLQPR